MFKEQVMIGRSLVRLIGIFIILFLVNPVIADETIQGHYCYAFGDRETIQEAREVVRTLSIRNGIESYRIFVESSTKVNNFSLTNDLVQTVSSGYLKNLKVLEHTEEGRTICEKISGTVKPEEIEKCRFSASICSDQYAHSGDISEFGILKRLEVL